MEVYLNNPGPLNHSLGEPMRTEPLADIEARKLAREMSFKLHRLTCE